MRHRFLAVLALLAGSRSTKIHAQAPGPLHFNSAAGAALPTGRLGDVADIGYNLTVGIGVRQPTSQVGFRVEGMYNEWSLNRTDFKTHAGGVTANLTYDFALAPMRGPGNSLYAIGGIGYLGTGGSSDIAYNIGGGFRFPLSGFSAYLEARYHSISNADMTFVPIVFGLLF